MRIEGDYTFSASRELVWSLLHDPVVLKQSLPGCDEFDQTATSDYVAGLHIQRGPCKGQYRGQIKLVDYEFHGRCEFALEGEGPEGPITATGTLSLAEQEGITTAQYAGDVNFAGQTAVASPRMLRTTANALIRQFFEAFERQVRIQTGVHTTTLSEELPRRGHADSVDAQNAAAKIEQDQRTVRLVIALIAFLFLTFSGALMILLSLARWGKRKIEHGTTIIVQSKEPENGTID